MKYKQKMKELIYKYKIFKKFKKAMKRKPYFNYKVESCH